MKRIILTLLTAFVTLSASAQVVDPVEWSYQVEKEGNQTATLIFRADIQPDWHLYSQHFPEGGPIRTNFNFNESSNYALEGSTSEEPEPTEEYDETFGINVKHFSDTATFRQKVKLNTSQAFEVTGGIEYQVCQEDKCVYFNPSFSFQVPAGASGETSGTGTDQESTTASSQAGDDLAGQEDETSSGSPRESSAGASPEVDSSQQAGIGGQDFTEGRSLLGFFLLSVVFGLAGILTPCVFPMIPMTVSFFMQESRNRVSGVVKALIFGLSIIILYTSVGLIVSLTSAGADFTTTLGTHWLPNSLFFLLFLTFAASFFGLFEIVLPSGLANKADKQVDKGGFLASFFMALTLVIVSFSCTGPIVGALLVKAVGGSVIEPAVGMLGFGLGFGLPFTILAISPGWLKKMPQSGGWMNSVKVVLGFIILAFAFKFLSNIDQNYHLQLLSRELYLSIWVAIFSVLGLYLLGKIKLPNDSDLKHLSVLRLVLAIASFSFAIYLVPGLFGASLSSISGILPPKTAQNFELQAGGDTAGGAASSSPTICEPPEYADFLNLPYGVKGYFKYDQGLQCARELNKPALVYFTGHSCSNCKQMQSQVWSNPAVQKRLREDYVLIALYIDDKKKLPESEWMKSDYDGKVKKTLGKKNAAFQIDRFNVNTQPYYRVLTPEGEAIGKPMGYTTKAQEFIDWLDKGVRQFQNQ